jgi:hypothetical protein
VATNLSSIPDASTPPSKFKLYVRNLHPEMSAAELLHAFRHCGEVVAGEIHREVLRGDLSSQAHHLLESKGKESRAARRSKVVSAQGKSPVYAFLYFRTEEGLARATAPSLRLFGLHAKGYTMYPEPASEKRTLYMQFSHKAILQQFNHHSAQLAAASNSASTASSASASSSSPSSSLSPYLSSPLNISNLNEFTMSRIQRDIYALLSVAGLHVSPYAQVKVSSKSTLSNYGFVHIECSSHELTDRVFSILHGHRIADQSVVLAWALTKPLKFDTAVTGEAALKHSAASVAKVRAASRRERGAPPPTLEEGVANEQAAMHFSIGSLLQQQQHSSLPAGRNATASQQQDLHAASRNASSNADFAPASPSSL